MAAGCAYVDDCGGVGIRLNPAAGHRAAIRRPISPSALADTMTHAERAAAALRARDELRSELVRRQVSTGQDQERADCDYRDDQKRRRSMVGEIDREHEHHLAEDGWREAGTRPETVSSLQTAGTISHGHCTKGAQQHIQEPPTRREIAFARDRSGIGEEFSGEACSEALSSFKSLATNSLTSVPVTYLGRFDRKP